MKVKVYHWIENIDFENFKKLFLFDRLKLSYIYCKRFLFQ